MADAGFDEYAEPNPSAPSVTTLPATGVGYDYFTMNGTITDVGSGACSVRGFQVSTTNGTSGLIDPQPSEENGTFGVGNWNQTVTGLSNGSTYYFRAYATNEAATDYGVWRSVVLESSIITIEDGETWKLSAGENWSDFNINIDAGATLRTVEDVGTLALGGLVNLGTCGHDDFNGTVTAQSVSGCGDYLGTWSDIEPDGCQSADAPDLTAEAASSVTYNSATLNATITDTNGTVTSCGFQLNDEASETGATNYYVSVPSGNASFSKVVEDLDENTLYYFRAFADNGTIGYSDWAIFTTEDLVVPETNAQTEDSAGQIVVPMLTIFAFKSNGGM